MKINPINTNNNISVFRAKIQPTQDLKNTFNAMEKSANSGLMKDMNFAKDFIDSIARISESKQINDFKIEVDKRRANYTYTKINGRRVSGGNNDRFSNLQDSYLVAEGVKNYAAKLEELAPSTLDLLKAKIEYAEQALDELKTRYSERLISEFEQAKKVIFDNVH